MNSTNSEKLEEFFLDLVELPADQRAARLDEICGDDQKLREELSRLLTADESRSGAADAGIIGTFASDPMPRRVGQYAINGIAGEGGMGAVYDAIHEPTRRRAAVKLLHVATSTLHGRARMRVEAETLGRLDSPNIARLYDAGVAEISYADGRQSHHPFIAMEFVDGSSIVDFSSENKLDDRQRLALMQIVAEAVHHAHQRGVMHRDLKPRNILVLADGTPKVVDFGIARLIDVAGENVTQTGQLLGTLRYMSPEQTAGDLRSVDTRTDVYALGAILFELLAGKPMVAVDTGVSLTAAMKILQSTPPRIAQLRPELAGDIDAIVQKATAFEVNDRYGSAQALADDLRLFLEGRDITARAPTALERFGRYVRRNKAQVAVAATIALLLLEGIIGTSWGLFRAERARKSEAEQRSVAENNAREAEKNAEAARNAEEDSRRFTRFLVARVLATARPTDIQGGLGLDVKVVDALNYAMNHIDTDFKGRPGAEAIARQAIGVTFRNRGDFPTAERELRRAAELADSSLGPKNEVTLDIQNSLLVTLQLMGKTNEIIPLQAKIVAGLEAAAGPRDRRTLAARYNLAVYHAKVQNREVALKMLEEVYAGRIATIGPEHYETLTTLADIAEMTQLMGDADKGVQLQREQTATVRRVFGEGNPQTLTSEYRLACLLRRTDRVKESAELLEAVVPGLSRTVGAQNVTTLDAKWQLASAYLSLHQSDRALPLMRDYESGQAKIIGEKSPAMLRTLNKTAVAFLDAQDLIAAEEFARKAVAIAGQTQVPAGIDARFILGQTLFAQGKLAEAEPILIEALGIPKSQPTSGPSGPQRDGAVAALIQIYERTNRPHEAELLRTGAKRR